MPLGRPTTYQPEFAELARRACEVGYTNVELATLFGVHESTVTEWLMRHPEFREAMKLGKAGPDDRVTAALYLRAIGFHFDSEKIFIVDGQVVRVPTKEYVIPDSHACTRWLVNRRPQEWRGDGSVSVAVGVQVGATEAAPTIDHLKNASPIEIMREYNAALEESRRPRLINPPATGN